MSKQSTRGTVRSSRRRGPSLKGRILTKDKASVQLSLPITEVLLGVEDALEALAAEAGLLVIHALLEDEVEEIAGRRYERKADGRAFRWGREAGHVVFAGRKVALDRPRVRTREGQEVALDRYQKFQSGGRLEAAVCRRIIRGVSTRDYEEVLDPVCEGYGVAKSSVSRHWKKASARSVGRLMERPLEELDLVVLMIDGIRFHDFLLVVALGITADGQKKILGLWPGATENTQVCQSLLSDLIDRGLPTDPSYLFVIDGAKALRKAIRATFGERGVVQRCRFHKEQNVLSHLPRKHHSLVRQRMRAAWAMNDYDEARASMLKVVSYLEQLNTAAARSLKEGLEETLTLHRLGVTGELHRVLRSSNSIESSFSRTRDLAANVKRWRSGDMAVRWGATVLLEAEEGFRRIKGFREMPLLISALRGVDVVEKVA